MPNTITFTVPRTVTLSSERVASVLCCAIDTDISMGWIHEIIEWVEPTTWEYTTDPVETDGDHYSQDYPVNPDGALRIATHDEGIRILDNASLQKGLEIMAEKYPHHFQNILEENEDAETGDVLLQCSLLGEIVYG